MTSQPNRRAPGRALAVACLTALVCAGAAAADPSGFLHPLGPIAKTQRIELTWATAAVMVAILPVLIGTPIILWRYRRSNTRATYRPQWHHDNWLEGAMWGVPIVIVVFLGLWLAQATFRIDPYRTIDAEMADELDVELRGEQIDVQVIGLDWKWLFLYPDLGIASVGEMVMPTHRPVALRLTTDTVMQAFLVPRLGGQIYAMPRMVTRLSLIADAEGNTTATNTQYTGFGMRHQRARVRAVSADAFETWRLTAEDAPLLSAETYATLGQAGTVDEAREALGMDGTGPILFRYDADTAIFDRVLARYSSPDGVARDAQPGSATYDVTRGALPEVQ